MRKAYVFEIARAIGQVVACSPLAGTDDLTAHAILNPVAGGFIHRSQRRPLLKWLRSGIGCPEHLSSRFQVHITEYPGHACAIAREIAERVVAGSGRQIVISIGGDGTHAEVLSQFVGLPEEALRRLCAYRIPAGTGNDAADGATFHEAVGRLWDLDSYRMLPVVRITDAKGGRSYAFNIGSVGLDGYVSYVTNQLKSRLPGNMYTVLADLAALFYTGIVGVSHGRYRFELTTGGERMLEGRYVLALFGASGGRRYGGNKPILPGEENALVVATPSLMRRIAIKGAVFRGEHLRMPEVSAFRAKRLTMEYDGRAVIQLDGEAKWLSRDDFPLVFELVDSAVPVAQVDGALTNGNTLRGGDVRAADGFRGGRAASVGETHR